MDEDLRAAVHEMGHAAIAILLGRTVRSVQLRPVPETRVEPRPIPKGRPRTDAERAALEAELMLAIAGVSAERVCGVAVDASGALDDLAKAADLARRLSGAARAEATVGHFLSVGERMLEPRQARLRSAATALRTAGRMEGSEVKPWFPRES